MFLFILAKLEGELQEVLKLRRFDLYTESGEEAAPDYDRSSNYVTTFQV